MLIFVNFYHSNLAVLTPKWVKNYWSDLTFGQRLFEQGACSEINGGVAQILTVCSRAWRKLISWQTTWTNFMTMTMAKPLRYSGNVHCPFKEMTTMHQPTPPPSVKIISLSILRSAITPSFLVNIPVPCTNYNSKWTPPQIVNSWFTDIKALYDRRWPQFLFVFFPDITCNS